MDSLIGVPDYSVPVTVPPQVERVRRISQLVFTPPSSALLLCFLGVGTARRVFGFGAVTSAVLGSLFIIGALLAMRWRRGGRFARIGKMRRYRWWPGGSALPVALTCGLVALLAICIFASGRESMSGPWMALFLLAYLAVFGRDWWSKRWWPRLLLVAAYTVVAALVLVWLPAPEKRFDTCALLVMAAAVLLILLDNLELYILLGEIEPEADGDPV